MSAKKISNCFLKFLNKLTKKIPNSIYINLGLSSKNNFEDCINYTGNNELVFLHDFINVKHSIKYTIFVDFFDENRIKLYQKESELAKQNNVNLIFVRSYKDLRGKNRVNKLINKYLCLFKSKIWIVGTGDSKLLGKIKKQRIINANYFISCKNDYIKDNHNRWQYLDGILTTSPIHSAAISSQTGVFLENCLELGFPRNDSLFLNKNKNLIYRWIKDLCGFIPNKIIIYAPTYRDYETGCSLNQKRFVFGYDLKDLSEMLAENKCCLIVKFHNLQNKAILLYQNGIIDYKNSYDFSFYDVLSIADCLITDYSSVAYDYMLLDKPIIYNLFDFEEYVNNRGLSYYPYDYFCPGKIVKNEAELIDALRMVMQGFDLEKEKRRQLMQVFHRHIDKESSIRFIEYIKDLLKEL